MFTLPPIKLLRSHVDIVNHRARLLENSQRFIRRIDGYEHCSLEYFGQQNKRVLAALEYAIEVIKKSDSLIERARLKRQRETLREQAR